MANKKAVNNLHTIFSSLVSAITSLDIKNPAKEILQPISVKFQINLIDGDVFGLTGRGIRAALGDLPDGKLLKLLVQNPADKEGQSKLTNARRVVIGYLLSILASSLSKRVLYIVAVIKESGLDIDDFIKDTSFTCEDGPMSSEVFTAIEVLAEFAVRHEGYKSIKDIFHRQSTGAVGLDDLPNL